MSSLPVNRGNRPNTLVRGNPAMRLRRLRSGVGPEAPSLVPAVEDVRKSDELIPEVQSEATGAPFELPAEPPGKPPTATAETSGDVLADALAAKIRELRDQLLEELQSSFAGLRADQEFAWSEQTALLKSLTEEVSTGLSVGVSKDSAAVAEPVQKRPQQLSQPVPKQAPQQALPNRRPAAEAGPADALQRWEAIRRNFLQTAGADLVESAEDTGAGQPLVGDAGFLSAAESSVSDWSPQHSQHIHGDPSELSDNDFAHVLPEPVHEEQISDTDLREIFRNRERILAELIGRYRRKRDDCTPLLSAEQLRGLQAALPSGLTLLVEQSLRRIDELTRLSEVELAFERARLSRERKQLEQSRFLLEHQARQMGLTLNPDGSLVRTETVGGRQNGRRWLGKLGFGNPQG